MAAPDREEVINLMKNNQWDLVEQSIRAGADPKINVVINNVTVSPLAYFAERNNVEMVEYIKEHSSADVLDFPREHSPLNVATIAGHLGIVDILVKAGADTNRHGEAIGFKFKPIQLAAMFGHLEVVKYFLKLVPHNPQKDRFDPTAAYTDLCQWYYNDMHYCLDKDMPQIISSEFPNYGEDTTPISLILETTTKHVTIQKAVPRLAGSDARKRSLSTQYLKWAQFALNVFERSIGPNPILLRSTGKFHKDRIAPIAVQKMAFSWFCNSIGTYVRNHPDIDAKNDGWKAISRTGRFLNCAAGAGRGYHYGKNLIGVDFDKIIDAAWDDIRDSFPGLKNFFQEYYQYHITNTSSMSPDSATLEALKATPFYQVSCFLNDFEQLSKLTSLHLDFDIKRLEPGTSSTVEIAATLNSVAAIIEVVTIHLSEFSFQYFRDFDTDTLQKIRNHLRHVNGDNQEHDAFAEVSRARRFLDLLTQNSSSLKKEIKQFMQDCFPVLRDRISSRKNVLESIALEIRSSDYDIDILYGKFKLGTSTMCAYTLQNTNSFNTVAKQLCCELEKEDHANYSYQQEDPICKKIRTETQIKIKSENEIELRKWNGQARKSLGLTKSSMEGLPKAEREEVRKLLPNPQNQEPIEDARKIHCYLRYAANMQYAIDTLQRLADANAEFRLSNNQCKTPSVNAIEWHSVHFYEHVADLVRDHSHIA